MDAIELRGLKKRYGALTAVDDLRFSIREGEIFGLLGVNGAGKSPTIKMLTGLTRPDAGDALLFGRSIVTQTAEAKELLAVCPQETSVAPKLSALENLELMAAIAGLGRAERQARIERTAHHAHDVHKVA